ncbi:Unknown protein sequence, partial [Pseudomonas syringae pv. coryli]
DVEAERLVKSFATDESKYLKVNRYVLQREGNMSCVGVQHALSPFREISRKQMVQEYCEAFKIRSIQDSVGRKVTTTFGGGRGGPTQAGYLQLNTNERIKKTVAT